MTIVRYLLVIFLCAAPANAEIRKPNLVKGMSPVEVINLWGAPAEKVEQEIKRRDIWIYENARLVFDNGRLVSGTTTDDKPLNLDPNNPLVPGAGAELKKKPAVQDQQVVDEILDEIMRDPSNSESEAPPPPVPGQPNTGM